MLIFVLLLPLCSTAADTLQASRLLDEGRRQGEGRAFLEALESFEAADAAAEKGGWTDGRARALNNAGVIYLELGEYEKAIKKHTEALKVLGRDGPAGLRGTCETSIGNVYFRQEQYEDALEHYQTARELLDPKLHPRQHAKALNNVGAAKARLEQYPEALQLYISARETARQLGDEALEAICLGNLGILNKRTGNFEAAINYYRKGLAIEERLRLPKDIATSLVNIGAAYAVQDDHAGAILYYDRALRIADSIRDMQILEQVHENLAASYEGLGDEARAYRHFKEFAAIREASIDMQSREAVARVRASYDFDQQRQELALRDAELQGQRLLLVLLGAGIALLLAIFLILLYRRRARATQQRLELENQMRDFERQALRLQMNPHFVFNSLTAIGGFIYQQDTAAATRFLGRFSRLMRLILEHASQPLIPLEIELDILRLYTEVEQARFEGRFSVEFDMPEDLDTQLMLPPMLIQPFVENAIQHGLGPKEEGGALRIALAVKGESLHCVVSDNGIGRAAAAKLRPAGHKPMGMEITQRRLDLLQKQTGRTVSFSIEDMTDAAGQSAGTRVTLVLPLEV